MNSGSFSRSFITLLCAGVLGAACTTTTNPPATDAGQTTGAGGQDAGATTAVPLSDQPIGAGCHADSDCTSGHCDTQPTGGYCLDACTTNSDCPAGAVCEQIGHRTSYCMLTCAAPSDCRDGYTCSAGEALCLPTKGCHANSDCGSGRSCDLNTGLCTGAIGAAAKVGMACTVDSQCTVGPYPFCLTEAQYNFPGGYCTAVCGVDSDCGPAGKDACVAGLTPRYSLCMATCKTQSDCRPTYNCLDFNSQRLCFAPCKTDTDCPGSGETCNVSNGLCSGGADAGPADAGPAPIDAGPADAGVDLDAGVVFADAGPGIDAGTSSWDGMSYPAPFVMPPQVITYGGPVLTAPKFVPVFFANDDPALVSKIADYDSKLGATNYWRATTIEYGVGPATATAPIILPEFANGTLADGDVQAWLEGKIGDSTLPAPDGNTLYLLHYPRSQSVSLQGQMSCGRWLGYHSNFPIPGSRTEVVYAVLPRCEQEGESFAQILATETNTESHEAVEAATDPEPQNHPAYATVDDLHFEWNNALGGSEAADMCAQDRTSEVVFPELQYSVQRSWSNAAATAGHDPCQPEVAGEVYFNAAPEANQTLVLDLGGGRSVTVSGTIVAPGQSMAVTVDLFSEGPVDLGSTDGTWNVYAADGSGANGSNLFTYSFDQTKGKNGDKLVMTISSPASTPVGTQVTYWLVSRAVDGSIQHTWIGYAGQ